MELWDHTNPLNPNVVLAVVRELLRVLWRQYYKALALYTMRLTNITNLGAIPTALDSLAIPVHEPLELEEFLTLVDTTFQAAQATYLRDLKEFKAMPRESLPQMAERYDEFAMPLLGAGLMTSRNLAQNLR